MNLKIQFIIAFFISFTILVLTADLDYVHSVIKIPIRALVITSIILPFYIVLRKKQDISTILFEKKLTKLDYKKLFFISIFLVTSGFIIRYFTYKTVGESFFTFGKSLHYGKYLLLYLTFGYYLHAILQEIAIILVFKGLTLFFMSETKTILTISLIFGIAHIYLGILSVILTFLTGLLFLIFYKMFKNLYAMAFMHYILGLVAISFGWS